MQRSLLHFGLFRLQVCMRHRLVVYGSGSPVVLVCRYRRERMKRTGVECFRAACEQDLPGTLVMLKRSAYGETGRGVV